MNTRFTIEEENIVAIYAEDSRETTLENILAAMPYSHAVRASFTSFPAFSNDCRNNSLASS